MKNLVCTLVSLAIAAQVVLVLAASWPADAAPLYRYRTITVDAERLTAELSRHQNEEIVAVSEAGGVVEEHGWVACSSEVLERVCVDSEFPDGCDECTEGTSTTWRTTAYVIVWRERL